MSVEVFNQVVLGLSNHAASLRYDHLNIIIQGGEPLLAGLSRFKGYLDTVARVQEQTEIEIDLSVHTNATLITSRWADFLADSKIAVGISLDGPANIANTRRPLMGGGSSFEKAMEGVANLKNVGVYPGALCVINQNADGGTVMEFFLDEGFPSIGFIFPAHNWIARDVKYEEQRPEAPYGEFLIKAFNVWLSSTFKPYVHNFDAYIRAIQSLPTSLSGIGYCPSDICSVAPDGSIEIGDSYGCCEYKRARGTSIEAGLKELYSTSFSKLQRDGGGPIPNACRDCSVRDYCRGGQLEHRYSKDRLYDNPSYYCTDNMRLYTFFATLLNGAQQ